MRKLFITAALMVSLTASAHQPQYERQDSIHVVQILQDASKLRAGTNLILYIARKFKDVPYVGHTLEPNDDERLIVNLRQLDCTTYVETVLALYRCVKSGKLTFADYCKQLQLLRYEGGAEPHYTKRLHYFTLWMEDNRQLGVCEEVQSPNPPFTAVQKVSVNWMTTHVSSYRMLANRPEWVPAIRQMEKKIEGKRYRYIPQAQVKNTRVLRNTVKDGDVIVIITNKKGLDTQHLGFASWHKDGLHLLNASSIHHKVIEEPITLRQYLYKHPTMPGIRILRIK